MHKVILHQMIFTLEKLGLILNDEFIKRVDLWVSD